MDYASVEKQLLCFPESNFEQFSRTARKCVTEFTKGNRFFELIEQNELELPHLHQLLNTLFHQVYNGSASFAMAGTVLTP